MCDHSEDKQHVYLEMMDHPDYEVYVCECGALINIQDPINYDDPYHPMGVKEIERMLRMVTPIADIERLREIADLKRIIFEEDKHRGVGLLVRDDAAGCEYRRLAEEARRIQRKLIGPNWWWP